MEKNRGIWEQSSPAAHLLLAAGILLACMPAASGQECTDAQKKKLKEFFEGRRVTARIDLPLVFSPGGLWVFWNGEYDLETYAESFKHGPASILRGQSSVIKVVRVRGKEILYGVGGRGLYNHWQGPYDKTPEEARRHGSLVSLTFGRKLTAADCSVEASTRALSGVLEIAGVETPRPPGGIAAAVEAAPVTAVPGPAPGEEPGFEVISAEVQPSRVRPGQPIRLITHLRVAGGAPAEVTESRQIYFEGNGLFSQPRLAASTWAPGVHQSTLQFRVPAAAGPGVYRYEVLVRALDKEEKKEALFEVY